MTSKQTRYAPLLILTAVILALFMGCDRYPAPIRQLFLTGTLELTLSNADLLERTLQPDVEMDVHSISISGSGPEGGTFTVEQEFSETILLEALAAGTWTIVIDASNSEGTVIGSATLVTTIVTHQTVSETVRITPLSGTGGLEYSISWTDSLFQEPSFTYSIFQDSLTLADALSSGSLDILGSTASFSTMLEAGYYFLQVTGYDGEDPVWQNHQAVRILAGEVTSGSTHLGDGQAGEEYLTEFSFTINDNPTSLLRDADGAINQDLRSISIHLPKGTAASSLAATFLCDADIELRVEDTPQTSGITVNDFSLPVTYSLYRNGTYLCDYQVFVNRSETLVLSDRTGSFSFTLDLEEDPRNVYFILSNPDTVTDTVPPEISSSVAASFAQAPRVPGRLTTAEEVLLLPDKRGIDEFNRIIPSSELPRTLFPEPYLSAAYSVGDTQSFSIDLTGSDTVAATCRKAVEAVATGSGSRNLYIWVENRSFSPGGDRTHLVTQAMVDSLADAFLSPGLSNDVYDWITAIYGNEWGAHDYSSLIPADTDSIHILLKDIDGDDSTSGGVLGYYWAKDNFRQGTFAGSNEKLMFYIDSVLFATPEGTAWDIDDYWPQIQISTLAHEFQHMIHYYRKNVRQGVSSETWLNEMCSLMAEDFIADKLNIPGPRGVAIDSAPYDYTAGDRISTRGRLPRFNRYNDDSVVIWQQDTDVLQSYSIAYAFGAYLARNFGGANLFNSIMEAGSGDMQAVEAALSLEGFPMPVAELLQRWGAAVVLSDSPSAEASLAYNNGSYFESTRNGIPFRLGSINLYQYSFGSATGPKFAGDGPVGQGLRASNGYYRSSAVSRNTWDFVIPEGSALTMIIR